MKIACIGNITYDYSVSMEGFIEEGIRNNFDNATKCPGGPASNAAYLLAKYGNNVDLYGQIGNDENGKFVYNEMKKENINLTHVSRSDEIMTPYSFIINNTHNNSRTILTTRSNMDFNKPTINNINYETNYDYILTDGKYCDESIKLLANNPNAEMIIDAGRVSRKMLLLCNFADYIICSEDFANCVTNKVIGDNKEKNIQIYNELKSYFPLAKELVITIGPKGYICKKDDEIITIPAYKPDAKTVDTTGAGDIFHGAFTHAFANGYNFHDSLEFANITASLSTTKKGGRYSCPELIDVEEKMCNIKKKTEKIKHLTM